MRRLTLVMLLAGTMAACSDYRPPSSSISDLDDEVDPTRSVFLERLSGCPIGGR